MTSGDASTLSEEHQTSIPTAAKGELKSHNIIADSANAKFDSPAGSFISESDAAQEAEERLAENQQQQPQGQHQSDEQPGQQPDEQLQQQPDEHLQPEQQQQDACTAEMQRLSALEANIEGKGQHSYYYAHKRKDTGEEPAPLPVAVVLERCVEAPTELFTTIFSYQFLDEKEHVKVYIPLDGVGAAIEDGGVVTSFQETSFEALIRGYKPQVLRLAIKTLHGAIVPELCRSRKFANKVTLTLVKKPSEEGNYSSWSKLTN